MRSLQQCRVFESIREELFLLAVRDDDERAMTVDLFGVVLIVVCLSPSIPPLSFHKVKCSGKCLAHWLGESIVGTVMQLNDPDMLVLLRDGDQRL